MGNTMVGTFDYHVNLFRCLLGAEVVMFPAKESSHVLGERSPIFQFYPLLKQI
jgi:hypothetical protein